MNLTILTHILPNYAGLADLTRSNRDEYCARHSYTHYTKIGTHGSLDWIGFQRIEYVRDMLFEPARVGLAQSPDAVWYLSVQSVLTNMTVPVTSHLGDETMGFYATPDRNVAINMGSFIVRRSGWARDWLNHIISLEPQYRNDVWYENRAVLAEWEKPEWRAGIGRLDQRTINSYEYGLYRHNWGTDMGQWHSGDLVLAFPGTSYDKRVELIKDALATKVTR